jgi:rare lipoprotein A
VTNTSELIVNKFYGTILCLTWVSVFLIMGCTKSIAPTPTPKGKPKPYRVGKTWYQPVSDAKGYKERGIASWYGKKFHGRKTSNGETYNMYAMTAAHKTLPLGTHLSVINLNNNKSVTVRINDRGPFVRGRIVDLSYSAAKKLEMISTGTAPVEITALGSDRSTPTTGSRTSQKPSIDFYSGNFTFQIGAFKNRDNAIRLKQRLEENYPNVHITEYDTGQDMLYRVRIGKVSSLEEAVSYENTLLQHGFKDVFIIAE